MGIINGCDCKSCEFRRAKKKLGMRLYTAADIKAAEERAWDAARKGMTETDLAVCFIQYETIAEWRDSKNGE